MIRSVKMAALGLALCLSAAPAAFAADDAPPWEAYGTAHLVSLPDGRRMNLICMGSGSPTVVLESGLGTHVFIWGQVQSKIAKTTKVCAYERAGMGVSDEGHGPRDAAAIDADLDALLHAAGLNGPYVVVGHSIGSYYTRLFADTHAQDVVGMVLVDPSIDNQMKLVAAIAPPVKPAQPPPPDPCGAAAEKGELKPGTDIYKACTQVPIPGLPDKLQAAIIAQATRAAVYRTVAAEVAAMDQNSVETLAARRSFGDMPLIVLTAGQSPKDPSMSDAQNEAWAKTWMQGHDGMAALSSRGQNRVVQGSGHFIQFEKPQAVIDAVDEVVAQARQKAGG